MSWPLRIAHDEDAPALERLIEHVTRLSLARWYSEAQLAMALGPVFGLDRRLIDDGTYFVVENAGEIIACGGRSKRLAVYGGDQERTGAEAELNLLKDAARVRAFFVHPAWERRGIGRALLEASESAIREAGFARVELVATLAGEALYARHAYAVAERYDAPIPGGMTIAVVRMTKSLT